jgi:cobalt-zinc-cadmium efflux system outer membrane protein
VAMSLAQKFPWFGKLGLRGQVAGHDAMAAYARLAAVELKVTEQVKRAYFDLYFLQRAIDVTRSLEPRLEQVVDISRIRFENAEVGLENVLKAQVELSRLQTRLIELEQAKAEAEARLAGVLHLPPATRIDARAEVDRVKLAHTAELLVQLAESHQPELDARRREISRDRSSVALACRDYWPDVTLSFNWYEIGSPGLSPVATGDDAYSMAVGVNLPLYRKRLDAAVREAQYKTARSARQYAATLDQVRAEVQALYAQFVQHDRVLEILEAEIVPRAEQTLELSIEAYRVGKLEFQQMIDSYEDLLMDRIETYRREALRQQVVASLERAVGGAVTAAAAGTVNDSEVIPVPSPAP